MDRYARRAQFPSDLTIERVTREGRKLSYKLSVLQQPERARACGSGAKSSADRRPVDPPPIVELQIFEGEGENLRDITLQMNASYFLFTTLQQARPIAPARGQPADKTCVLTGTPVAGMVYLDRPKQAGYFIFPDLSIRHEGSYRLSFNLYEELKEPQDADRKSEDQEADQSGSASGAHVTHRMEVFSQEFSVFSAKKFPGLQCSTILSRTVAEQGCRVRIRREARVRKRKEDGHGYEDNDDHAAGEYEGYPSGGIAQRPRSDSAGSRNSPSSMPLVQDSRRTSQIDMPSYGHQFVHPHQQQQQPQQSSGPYAQVPYGTGVHSHYPPTYHMPHSAVQATMPPPPPQMQHSGYGQPQMANGSQQQQQYYGYAAATQHQPSYVPAPAPYDNHRHHSYDSHSSMQHEHQRLPSTQSYSHQQSAGYGGLENYATGYRSIAEPPRQPAPSIASSAPGSMTQSMKLPPINTNNLPPLSSRDVLLEASPSTAGPYSNYNTDSSSRHASIYGSSSISSIATPVSKRSHSNAFAQPHEHETLHDRQRPSLSLHGVDGSREGIPQLSYRRADGSQQSRPYANQPGR